MRITRRAALCSAGALVWERLAAARVGEREWVERTIGRMTLAEKTGQTICTHARMDNLDALAADGKLGVLFVPRPSSPSGLLEFVNHYQGLAKTPLLMIGGIEGGAGEAVTGATQIPMGMGIGATRSEAMAALAGRIMGAEYQAMGVQWPGPADCDVNIEAGNPIINTRSFGDSPELVARMAIATIRGLHAEGSVAWANHFPGHGATKQDSHRELPTVDRSLPQLEEIELRPFAAAFEAGVDAVGTAHIWFPALEPEKGLPATLSKRILTGLLRDKMHFRGVVTSDSFAMQAIRHNFDEEKAVVTAMEAGNDVVLAYPETGRLYEALFKAAQQSAELRARIDQAVRRILGLKFRAGLVTAKFPLAPDHLPIVGSRENEAAARRIARAAFTGVKNAAALRDLRTEKNPLFILPETRKRQTGEFPHEVARAMLARAFPASEAFHTTMQPTGEEAERAIQRAKTASRVVFLGFTRVQSYDPASVKLGAAQADLARRLSTLKPVDAIVFGSPYALEDLAFARALACAYDDAGISIQAGVDYMRGEFTATGRLPVKLNGSSR